MLSEEQQEIFDTYKKGQNIFITGPGGCGKSFLIRHIKEDAELRFTKKQVQVCAMTGCAAILLECGATTLHSWAGIGIANKEDDKIIHHIISNKYKRKNWRQTKLLIVDEVSMMSKRMFELLNNIGKAARNNRLPFGGIQVIFSGDFYQLPPINDAPSGEIIPTQFCFESSLWNTTFEYQFVLDHIYRQNDPTYAKILNQVREGNIYKEAYDILKTRIGVESDDEIQPIQLLPIKRKVNEINMRHLNELNTDEITYTAKAEYIRPEGSIKNPSYREPSQRELEFEKNYLMKNSRFDEQMVLKVGCQVMCIANIDMDKKICNGTTGIITGFTHAKELPIVRLSDGSTYVFTYHKLESEKIPGFAIHQIPLTLAWAITIHKSQGATLESATMDLGKSIFSAGQIYVALSRVKSIEGLYLKSFDYKKIFANPKVKEFYDGFYVDSDEEECGNEEECGDDEDISGNITNAKGKEIQQEHESNHESKLIHLDKYAYVPN